MHYYALLGMNMGHEYTLDLSQFIAPCDLSELDTPFSEAEIWSTVKRLPARKAP